MRSASSRFSNELRYRGDLDDGQAQLTPAYVLDAVRAALGGSIELDPCTEPGNPAGADRFYCPPADGACEPWDADTIFVNPPYSRAREPWVRKCIAAGLAGSKVVLLIPAATDTRIFQDALSTADQVLFLRGRVKFGIPRENGRQAAASHPSALIGWGADLELARPLGLLLKTR